MTRESVGAWLRLDSLESELEDARRAVLVRSGWKHTSDTPDFVWRWKKELPDGTNVLCSEHEALAMQRAIEAR
jgi:hypothetical protein